VIHYTAFCCCVHTASHRLLLTPTHPPITHPTHTLDSPQALDFYDGTATNKLQRPSLTLTFGGGSVRGQGNEDGPGGASPDGPGAPTTTSDTPVGPTPGLSPPLLAICFAVAGFATTGAAIAAVWHLRRLRAAHPAAKARSWHRSGHTGAPKQGDTVVTSPLARALPTQTRTLWAAGPSVPAPLRRGSADDAEALTGPTQ
jgi:hypothetical protein